MSEADLSLYSNAGVLSEGWYRVAIDGPWFLDYSNGMLMPRRTLVLSLTVGCLLASWLSFGCLEFLEQVNVIPETAAEDQSDQDLDEAALSQLASGLKSDALTLDIPCGTSTIKERSETTRWLSVHPVHLLAPVIVQSPPSLRLHQKHSVYRI